MNRDCVALCAAFCIAGCLLAWLPEARAQSVLNRTVCGSGGMVTGDNAGRRVTATIGQPVVGPTNSFSLHLSQGFWNAAGRRSAATPGFVMGAAPSGNIDFRASRNPFAATTDLHIQVPRPAAIDVALYDCLGRLVRVLADGKNVRDRFDIALEADGLAAGVYTAVLRVGAEQASIRLVLAR